MKTGLMPLYVLMFIAGNVLSCIAFKYAADQTGKATVWYFIVGNVVGILGPIALTLALRGTNPNVTYALCYGTSFAALQLVSWRLFNQPLSHWQILGVACVGVGICLLQVGAKH